MNFILYRTDVALFVADLLMHQKTDYASIMITNQAQSGGYCVTIATDTSSEDFVKMLAQPYLKKVINISQENILDG